MFFANVQWQKSRFFEDCLVGVVQDFIYQFLFLFLTMISTIQTCTELGFLLRRMLLYCGYSLIFTQVLSKKRKIKKELCAGNGKI